jgi:hypothetical protein
VKWLNGFVLELRANAIPQLLLHSKQANPAADADNYCGMGVVGFS